MIGKGDLILGILGLYDELDDAKRAAAEGRRPFLGIVHADDGSLSPIDERMIEAGRAKVYEASMYSWKECRATRDNETGAVSVTPYDRWLMEKVGYIPDYMSKSEFYEYFADRLKEDYEREKQDAIAKLAVEGDDE